MRNDIHRDNTLTLPNLVLSQRDHFGNERENELAKAISAINISNAEDMAIPFGAKGVLYTSTSFQWSLDNTKCLLMYTVPAAKILETRKERFISYANVLPSQIIDTN